MLNDNQPVEANGRFEAMHYMCYLHNLVNERLGKEIFDCKIVEDMWGRKGCGCDPASILNQTKEAN
jgi:hypothetical protein